MINRQELKNRAREFLSGGTYLKALVFTSLVYLSQLIKIIKDLDTGDYYLYIDSFGVIFEKGVKIANNQVVTLSLLSLILSTFLYPLLKSSLNLFYMNKKEENLDYRENRISERINSDNRFNVILTFLFMRVKIMLWTLLLVIPGLIKQYEYYFVPYIIAEYPSMNIRQVFKESRHLTEGSKFDLFLLDLSFIGWYIIAAFLPGASYLIHPYKEATKAQAYLDLAARKNIFGEFDSESYMY